MKIIHLVLGKANPERMNGVNKVAHNLATAQTNMGYHVNLWGIANDLEHNYPERNYTTILFQQYKNKFLIDPNLNIAIQELDTDTVIHIHGAFIPEFFNITRKLDKQNVPYIYTPHGAITEGAMSKNAQIKKLYFKLFESKLIKNAKSVQLLGKNEQIYLSNMLQTENTCLIPNGQDWDSIKNFGQTRPSNQVPIFGFCGRLAKHHKGLDLLLIAFKNYITNGFDGKLELIGDGPDRPYLEHLADQLKIEHKTIFHGKKFGDEKFNLISQFDVFMHPSRNEGFPTAVLEAAALKIPCITSEASNVNDYIRQYNAGLPLTINTSEHIAETMGKAFNMWKDHSLSSLGDNAFKMIQSAFDWKNISNQLIQVYASE